MIVASTEDTILGFGVNLFASRCILSQPKKSYDEGCLILSADLRSQDNITLRGKRITLGFIVDTDSTFWSPVFDNRD